MNDLQPPVASAPMALRCPKCAAEMTTYERSGIVVDQCRECRGIFLDRGELERLVDAESGGSGWAGPRMNVPPPVDPRLLSPRPVEARAADHRPDWHDWNDDRDDRDERDDRRRSDASDPRPPKRRSILGEILEGLGD
jgi:Zn-finger nucleic acid-binding protein